MAYQLLIIQVLVINLLVVCQLHSKGPRNVQNLFVERNILRELLLAVELVALVNFLMEPIDDVLDDFLHVACRMEAVENQYALLRAVLLAEQVDEVEFAADPVDQQVEAAFKHEFHLLKGLSPHELNNMGVFLFLKPEDHLVWLGVVRRAFEFVFLVLHDGVVVIQLIDVFLFSSALTPAFLLFILLRLPFLLIFLCNKKQLFALIFLSGSYLGPALLADEVVGEGILIISKQSHL